MDAVIGPRRVPTSASHRPAWLWRTQPRPRVVDAALATAFLVAAVAERVGAAPLIGSSTATAIGLAAIMAGALAMRRQAPMTAYLVSSLAMLVEERFVLISDISPNANLVQLYSVGLYATRSRARLAPVVALVGFVAYFAPITRLTLGASIAPLLLWLLAWAFGYTSARRQEERETARVVLRRQIVSDERAHIARELHDLVGHSLNVMLVQAGAARRVLDRDPEQARDLLTSLESTGRGTFDELDRVLGLLRRGTRGGSAAAATPGDPAVSPGLADLARLTERLGQAGLRITLAIDARTSDLPRSIDMSAYRIVQESLTNTVKHARADSADVRVRHCGQVLDIEVRDDGHGAVDGYAIGRGILGITERVSLFGGTVEHGAGTVDQTGGERGGFRVHAVLPIPR